MHYVVGDVHGCYQELIDLVTKIEKQDNDATIIFVGDWLDRGPKQKDTLLWMLEHVSSDGKYQSVRGNHDEMAIQWYRELYLPWFQEHPNCAEDNLTPPCSEYDFYISVRDEFQHDIHLLDQVINKLDELPYNKLIQIEGKENTKIAYRVMHAWHTDSKDEEEVRYVNLHQRKYSGHLGSDEIYVHGHTPTILDEYYIYESPKFRRPGMIGYRENDINVDGGCFFLLNQFEAPCMLCGICLETLDEFYCDTVEARLEKAIRHHAQQMYARNHKFQDEDEYVEKTLIPLVNHYKKANESYQRKRLKERLGINM